MNASEKPCEQVGLMPHAAHTYTASPTDPRDAFYCPGHPRPLPIHRTSTEAGYPRCATCDGGGCLDCTDPA